MLERFVVSEVENLHLRVDSLFELIERIDERLIAVERQVGLLTMAVEDLRVEIRSKFLTKEDAKQFATKEDLKQCATKDNLKQFATKSDVEDLKNFFIQLLKLA